MANVLIVTYPVPFVLSAARHPPPLFFSGCFCVAIELNSSFLFRSEPGRCIHPAPRSLPVRIGQGNRDHIQRHILSEDPPRCFFWTIKRAPITERPEGKYCIEKKRYCRGTMPHYHYAHIITGVHWSIYIVFRMPAALAHEADISSAHPCA